MLGWRISVYEQIGNGGQPAAWEFIPGVLLAVWQTGLGGLDWLRALA